MSVPRAIEIDLGRAAACDRAHLEDARHPTEGVLEGTRDDPQHLVAGTSPLSAITVMRGKVTAGRIAVGRRHAAATPSAARPDNP